MRTILFLLLFFLILTGHSQSITEAEKLFQRFIITETIPDKLLSARAVVLYDDAITTKELEETQKMFQQTGIDAVAYFITDHVLAGPDMIRAFSTYLTNRVIEYLIFFEKKNDNYALTVVRYNNSKNLVDASASAWQQSNTLLSELLKTVYRNAVSNLKKQNLLISDYPETGIALKYFSGRRNENFTSDAVSFKIAVVRWGNEKENAELEQILKEYFPVKYELVDPQVDDRELSRIGCRTVLRFVHTKGIVAKEILGYDLSQLARSLTSVYYVKGEADLKAIPASQTVYKFYVKHIEYGNLFLGKGWDADVTWQDALKNHLQAMRETLQF